MILEKGKRLFQDSLYGDALMRFEDAIKNRHDLFDQSERDLIDVLSRSDVRRYGDDLAKVEEHINSHKLNAARLALDALYKVVEKKSLANSVQNVLSQFKALKDYPEAEYWKGEVFRVEGELSIALAQYEKALSSAALLEIPDEARMIRYKIASLRASRREYNEMEKQLLSIIAEDTLWSSQSQNFARESMNRTLINDGVDRFLTLYRHASASTYKAHQDLGLYYYRTGRHDRAFSQLVFAFLDGSTTVIDELRSADQDFTFTKLSTALDAARGRRSSAGEFLQNSEYFKTLYYLGASLYANGQRKRANEIWRLLVARPEAGEWAGRASKQIAAPYIEPSTDTP